MRFEVMSQEQSPHRHTTFSMFVNVEPEHFRFDNIEVFIVKFDCDQKWWIVPGSYDDDALMEDHGPFDTHEDAIIFLKLRGEN